MHSWNAVPWFVPKGNTDSGFLWEANKPILTRFSWSHVCIVRKSFWFVHFFVLLFYLLSSMKSSITFFLCTWWIRFRQTIISTRSFVTLCVIPQLCCLIGFHRWKYITQSNLVVREAEAHAECSLPHPVRHTQRTDTEYHIFIGLICRQMYWIL